MVSEKREELALPEAMTHLLEECRMVLPGIQTLFGFQLIVVFNNGFDEKLSSPEKLLHLCAIGFVGVAVALVMAPAAFHRQDGPQSVSQDLISIATRLLLWSMFPLMVGICLDFYLIAKIILMAPVIAVILASLLFCIFVFLWFCLPRFRRLRKLLIPEDP